MESIDVGDLRKKVIAIIPQVPIIFRGDAQSNVDPLGISATLAVAALHKVGFPGPIDIDISDVSSGARALVAVARVLVQLDAEAPHVKVLIVDEVAASLSDKEAERVLQAIAPIQSTMLVVTHQPKTCEVLSCTDRLLVANGKVVHSACS